MPCRAIPYRGRGQTLLPTSAVWHSVILFPSFSLVARPSRAAPDCRDHEKMDLYDDHDHHDHHQPPSKIQGCAVPVTDDPDSSMSQPPDISRGSRGRLSALDAVAGWAGRCGAEHQMLVSSGTGSLVGSVFVHIGFSNGDRSLASDTTG